MSSHWRAGALARRLQHAQTTAAVPGARSNAGAGASGPAGPAPTLRRRRAGARCLATLAPPAPEASEAKLQHLFGGAPALILERAMGERSGSDQCLWERGAFGAEVYPDLPVATSWRELLPRMWRGGTAAANSNSSGHAGGGGGRLGWHVQTLAGQLRGVGEVRQMLCGAAAGTWPAGGPPADAVLVVSGGHPVRALPGVSHFLSSSFDILRLASEMRAAGELPSTLSLWAVENPALNPVVRLAAKADAGAQVVVTQPLLLWERGRAWAEAAAAAGLTQRVRLVVGVPIVSSAANLDFWLRLCDVRQLPEAQALLAAFPPEAHGDGRAAWQAAVREWNAALIRRTLALPGVAGLHVMPLTKVARELTTALLEDGTLPGGLRAPASHAG
eukprot:scaffold3.g6191.t1